MINLLSVYVCNLNLFIFLDMPNLKSTKEIVFLIAGRTGGPFSPLKAISENLGLSTKNVYIGVKNGFEDIYCKKFNHPILYLPEVKLSSLSFKNQTFQNRLFQIWNLTTVGFGLIYSFSLAFFYAIRFRPKLAINTGSFLSIPVFIALKTTNFLGLTKTKLVVHQQDPLPGIANKITSKWSHVLSCVFSYTKEKFAQFNSAEIIPNPLSTKEFEISKQEALYLLENYNPTLFNFIVKTENKPLLLVFGGGSGSQQINHWMIENLDKLTQKFKIIHLIGELHGKETLVQNSNYLSLKSLFVEMPAMMVLADLVICRSGLGSITELQYLQKLAFLIPIQHSHQELNARLVSDKFWILTTEHEKTWLDKVLNYEKLPILNRTKQISREEYKLKLTEYYEKINQLVEGKTPK